MINVWYNGGWCGGALWRKVDGTLIVETSVAPWRLLSSTNRMCLRKLVAPIGGWLLYCKNTWSMVLLAPEDGNGRPLGVNYLNGWRIECVNNQLTSNRRPVFHSMVSVLSDYHSPLPMMHAGSWTDASVSMPLTISSGMWVCGCHSPYHLSSWPWDEGWYEWSSNPSSIKLIQPWHGESGGDRQWFSGGGAVRFFAWDHCIISNWRSFFLSSSWGLCPNCIGLGNAEMMLFCVHGPTRHSSWYWYSITERTNDLARRLLSVSVVSNGGCDVQSWVDVTCLFLSRNHQIIGRMRSHSRRRCLSLVSCREKERRKKDVIDGLFLRHRHRFCSWWVCCGLGCWAAVYPIKNKPCGTGIMTDYDINGSAISYRRAGHDL